jgi:tetratricopeptide (TPR) repeat protein
LSPVLLLLLGGGSGLLLLLLGLLWQGFGPGPRRARRFRQAQRDLQAGNWRKALEELRELHQQSNLPTRWEQKIRLALADCYAAAGQSHLNQKDYERALDLLERSAELLQQSTVEVRQRVSRDMLEEARRLFAQTEPSATATVHQFIARLLILQSHCPEASFWQALCFLREGKTEQALATLQQLAAGPENAVTGRPAAAEKCLDPYLYYGALLLQKGEARESLRQLTEANRIDSNCPFVSAQLGGAMLAAGGDPQFALRALQRALGPRGLPQWPANSSQVWVEAFPEGKSYVRRLASKYPFRCPLWGNDSQLIQRQANTALADAYYRLGQFEQAVEIYDRLSHESAPSLAVLRGLGLSLVRLGRYDQAFKHLRAVHELEQPKSPLTAAYLALCGTRGKPATPEDKINNVRWAVWLIRNFSVPGHAEFVDLLNQIYAEARACGLPLDLDDQLHICEHLLSIDATDPLAAEAFHQLALTYPDAVRLEYACLHCRAAQLHGLRLERTPDLFSRLFREADQARPFFEARQWPFDDLEYTFLEAAAAQQPGQFPAVLGPAYPPRGVQMLLERARRLQATGQTPAALAAAQVLVQLAPDQPDGYDCLAQLHFQSGQLEEALQLLEDWHNRQPSAWQPLVRLAMLAPQCGHPERALDAIRQALALTQGKRRGAIAFLGARLELRRVLLAQEVNSPASAEELAGAAELLGQCLVDIPEHTQARWCLAAVLSLQGATSDLAAQAAALERAGTEDPRAPLLAALAHLAAGQPTAAASACDRVNSASRLTTECDYLRGWAAVDQQNPTAAAASWERTAASPEAPSKEHARALLGGLQFFGHDYAAAARTWQQIPAAQRAAWQLDAPLAQTMYLSALEAYHARHYAEAATRLREAAKLGLRDPRLGQYLSQALVQAGRQLLYSAEGAR